MDDMRLESNHDTPMSFVELERFFWNEVSDWYAKFGDRLGPVHFLKIKDIHISMEGGKKVYRRVADLCLGKEHSATNREKVLAHAIKFRGFWSSYEP